MTGINLYGVTRKLTDSQEDLLTCFWAVALESDAEFRRAVADRLLGPFAREKGWTTPVIEEVDLWPSFDGSGCIPDLGLRLATGHLVVCEHKLYGTMTAGRPSGADEPRDQLERYLALDVDGVAFIRADWRRVPPETLSHPKYVKPQQGSHYVWRDFYPDLLRGSHPTCRWLREEFEREGNTPPDPRIGDLWPDDTEEVIANQSNFGKLWGPTRAWLERHGWDVSTGRRCEIYAYPAHDSGVTRLHCSPLARSGTMLRVRLEVPSELVAPVERELAGIAETLDQPSQVLNRGLAAGAAAVDVLVPLGCFFEALQTVEEMEEALLAHVMALTALDVVPTLHDQQL